MTSPAGVTGVMGTEVTTAATLGPGLGLAPVVATVDMLPAETLARLPAAAAQGLTPGGSRDRTVYFVLFYYGQTPCFVTFQVFFC